MKMENCNHEWEEIPLLEQKVEKEIRRTNPERSEKRTFFIKFYYCKKCGLMKAIDNEKLVRAM